MRKITLLSLLSFFVVFFSITGFAATSWYLPEGSTQGKDFWVVVNNPNSETASLKFTFYTDTGTVEYTDTTAANTRYTLYVNGISGLDEKPISTKVECTNGLNIYAERAIYFPKGDPNSWTWGQAARGTSGIEGCYYEIESLPYTISRSGTYRVTKDLTCTQDNNGITIGVDDVTIDLNGFTLTGAGQSTGSTGNGITSGGLPFENITIKNGNIREFKEYGIDLVAVFNIQIENVKTYNNGSFGIRGGFGGVISHCSSYGNSGGGISVSTNFIISENSCYANSSYGIYIDNANIVKNNSVYDTRASALTGTAGICVVSDDNTISDNIVSQTASGLADITVIGSSNQILNNLCGSRELNISGNQNRIVNNHIIGTDGTNSIVFQSGATYNFEIRNTYGGFRSDSGTNTVSTLTENNNRLLF